jgi:hypothetical protein
LLINHEARITVEQLLTTKLDIPRLNKIHSATVLDRALEAGTGLKSNIYLHHSSYWKNNLER